MTARETTLYPYAAVIRFSAGRPLPEGRWRDLLAKLLEGIAARCDASGASVIGHIKALSLFDAGRYLRASVVSPRHPADVEGNPPGEFRQMEITLNVLVYGLERSAIASLVTEAVAELGRSFEGSVALFPKNRALPLDMAE